MKWGDAGWIDEALLMLATDDVKLTLCVMGEDEGWLAETTTEGIGRG